MYSSNNPHIFSVLRIDQYSETAEAQANQPSYSQLKGGKPPYTFLDGPPRFPGDMPGLYAYLRSNVIYPEEARKQRITGKVFVSFVITQDGSVTDVKIEKGIGGGCDEAAIEAVTNMPRWKPGSQNGKPVRVKYNIPISFSL
ncbi:MAG: energy transducer TonB [Pedobacter sp.]|nr:MAG: energy transducer TonB [Pedobacter sp.]